MEKVFKRRHVRAPHFSHVLYLHEDHVLKGESQNISEGGILIRNLPLLPQDEIFYAMTTLCRTPDFASAGVERLMSCTMEEFPFQVIRFQGKIVRQFEGKTEIDKIFMNHIGCEIFALSEESLDVINKYVSSYAKNMLFVLEQFESSHKHSEFSLTHLASLLGHPVDKFNLVQLRHRLLHDYQSLEGT